MCIVIDAPNYKIASLTVFIKSCPSIMEGLKFFSIFPHELDSALPKLCMPVMVTINLICKCSEQAISMIKTQRK